MPEPCLVTGMATVRPSLIAPLIVPDDAPPRRRERVVVAAVMGPEMSRVPALLEMLSRPLPVVI